MAEPQAPRPRTPPGPTRTGGPAQSPITPEQIRRMEESRLKAKALREQREREQRRVSRIGRQDPHAPSGNNKRPFSAISTIPPKRRDGRNPTFQDTRTPTSNNGLSQAQDIGIRAARKFQKYVEYDFSKMTDTKGGFMTQEDDPYNRTLHAPDSDEKPAHMTAKDWERQQALRKLNNHTLSSFEPGLSVLHDRASQKKCRECGSLEIDWQWDEILHTSVCNSCKEKYPDKYSLLTKTEAKEDYLLTDPELKDELLLPHLEKPNPHKSTWNNMMLYLRYQVEDYAFSDQKWGSAEALDEEFEKRQRETKERKEKKFRNKLNELKKRTRVDAYKRGRAGGGGDFGDTIGRGRHEHEWGRSVEDPDTGMTKKRCIDCGIEVEELEF